MVGNITQYNSVTKERIIRYEITFDTMYQYIFYAKGTLTLSGLDETSTNGKLSIFFSYLRKGLSFLLFQIYI